MNNENNKILTKLNCIQMLIEDILSSHSNPLHLPFVFDPGLIRKAGNRENKKFWPVYGKLSFYLKISYMLGINIQTNKILHLLRENRKNSFWYFDQNVCIFGALRQIAGSIKNIDTFVNPFFLYRMAETRQVLSAVSPFIGNVKISEENFRSINLVYEKTQSADERCKKPWATLSHLSHFCFFTKMLEDGQFENQSRIVSRLNSIKNLSQGGWGDSMAPSDLVNGIMKATTGLQYMDQRLLGKLDFEKSKVAGLFESYIPNDNACELANFVIAVWGLKNTLKIPFSREFIGALSKMFIEAVEVHEREYNGHVSYAFYVHPQDQYYYGAKVKNSDSKHGDLHGTLMITWGLICLLSINGAVNASGYKQIKA